MDAEINNPAGRLHLFFEHCSASNGSVPLVAIWGGYFADSESPSDFATCMADLVSLPQQMRSALEGAPAAPTLPTAFLVEQVPKLEALLQWGMFHLDSPTAHFNQKYDQGDLARLEMASHTLSGLAPAGVTKKVLDEIVSLGAKITKLLVDDDSLEPELRDLLFELSNGIRRISESYQVRGPVAIARERDLLVGRLVNNPQLAAKLLGHKEATHLVRNIFIASAAAMTFFNTAADTADNVPKMIENVSRIAELIAPAGDALHDAVQQQIEASSDG